MIERLWGPDKSKEQREAGRLRHTNLKPLLLIDPPSPSHVSLCRCIFKEPHQTIKTAMAQLLFTAKLGKVRGAGSSILVIGGEAILTASTSHTSNKDD